MTDKIEQRLEEIEAHSIWATELALCKALRRALKGLVILDANGTLADIERILSGEEGT